MMRNFFFLILLFACWSCSQKSENPLTIRFNWQVNNSPFALETPFQLRDTTIVFTTVKIYLSNSSVWQGNTNTPIGNDEVFLLTPDLNTWVLSIAESVDSITGFEMGIGVPASLNDSSGLLAKPAYSYPSGHPLSVENDMYWGWNPGYVFIKLEGRFDANNNGQLNDAGETFSIHTGLNAAYTSIQLPIQNAQSEILVGVNPLQFLNDFDLKLHRNVHPFSINTPEFAPALTIQNNARYVFSVQP